MPVDNATSKPRPASMVWVAAPTVPVMPACSRIMKPTKALRPRSVVNASRGGATRPSATPGPDIGEAGGGPIELTAPKSPGVPATAPGTAGSPGNTGLTGTTGSPGALDVFFVVMDVNGRAIFSDKVLKLVERPLAAEAKRLGPDEFRKRAKYLIDAAIGQMAGKLQ